MKEGEEKAYDAVLKLGYLQEEEKLCGSEDHYNFFAA